MDSKIALFVVLIIGLMLVSRITAHFLDKDRVQSAAARKGWRQIKVQWDPYSRGNFFERTERFYSVSFEDRDGVRRRLQCKTSLFTGVSWIDPHYPGM